MPSEVSILRGQSKFVGSTIPSIPSNRLVSKYGPAGSAVAIGVTAVAVGAGADVGATLVGIEVAVIVGVSGITVGGPDLVGTTVGACPESPESFVVQPVKSPSAKTKATTKIPKFWL
jgi:hypothetical protein